MARNPLEFSFATPEDLGGKAAYRKVCRVAGLHPIPDGYGMLHCEDENGKHWTLMTSDVEYVRAVASAGLEVLAGLEIPEGKFPREREGWPDEWI